MLRPLVRPLVRALTRSPMESRGLRPALSLDFTNGGVTDSRVTYSGGANGTRVNSAGLIVAATTPRFDYNPVTLAPLGLLVEEARTNLLTYSQEFDNAAWNQNNVTVTANATTSPDGTANADAIFETAVNSTHSLLTGGSTVVAGAAESFSLYVKPNGRTVCMIQVINGAFSNGFRAEFTLTGSGTVSANLAFGAGTFTGATITPAANGFYRCTVSGIVDGVATSVRVQCLIESAVGTNSYLGNITKGLYLWGAQLEAGSFPTSYIPTTSAALTRSADSAVMTGTNFSSWFNPSEGTFVVEYSLNVISGNAQSAICIDDGTTANFSQLVEAGGVMYAEVITGSVGQAFIAAGAEVAQTKYRAALAFPNDVAACLNGGAVVADASVTLPTVDRLRIGYSAAGQSLNGHIRSISYFPQRLANATLQGMTA